MIILLTLFIMRTILYITTTENNMKTVSPDYITHKAALLEACSSFRGEKIYNCKNEKYEGLVRIYWSKYSEKIEIDWNYSD